MIEQKRPLVPIEEVRSNTARFAVNLPDYLDRSLIGVDINGIERLCRIGGISHVRVVTESNRDQSGFYPAIVGTDLNGEAIAGMTGTNFIVPTFCVESEEIGGIGDSQLKPHASTWINTKITVNPDEVSRRILDNPKWESGVRSPQAWAYHLNSAVREGIRNSGIKHLTMGLDKFEWGKVAMQYALMTYFEALNPSFQSAAFRVLFVSAVLNTIAYAGSKARGEDYRWSLMYGPQMDRAFALKLMSTRARLIEGLPKAPSSQQP